MNENPLPQPPAPAAQAVVPPRRSWWSKLGGGALTIAIVIHLILLGLGAMWVFQIIHPPEKVVDFMPGNGKDGGGERGLKHQVQQKRLSQITPSTNVKRVFAEGAVSAYALPEQGDDFGEMSALSSLAGGGGMSGGLGGSGGGTGFGLGSGGGAGGKGLAPVMMFGLELEGTEKVAVVMDVSRSMTKYLPIVARELDKIAARGPLILYFGCGLANPPKNYDIEDKVLVANGPAFDSFWQNWQGKAALGMPPAERKKLKYDPNAPMPLKALHDQMSKRLDTYFIEFNGIHYTQTALLCKEVRDADTIYWFADFQDRADAEQMKDVLRKLKSRRQKLFMHATTEGRSFEKIRDAVVLPSGGKVLVKEVK